MDGAQNAGWNGSYLVEILHLEAVAVLLDKRFVVVTRECGPSVGGRVVDVDFQAIRPRLQELGDIEAVGWMPESACWPAVEDHEGGFMKGRVVEGVHAGAGTGDEGIGETVGAAYDVLLRWRIGSTGEGLAAFNLEEDGGVGLGSQAEVARVDGLAGVVQGCGVGCPVGEGGLCD